MSDWCACVKSRLSFPWRFITSSMSSTTSSTKAMAAPKASPTKAAASKMHRRSRSGMLPRLKIALVHVLSRCQVASHADCGGRSVTKRNPSAKPANIWVLLASTRGPCGGAIMNSEESRKRISRQSSKGRSLRRKHRLCRITVRAKTPA